MTIERLFNAIAQFYGGDPVIAWWLTFAVLMVLASIMAVARAARDERRQQREAEAFERQLALKGRPTIYPPPSGKKGFQQRRKAS